MLHTSVVQIALESCLHKKFDIQSGHCAVVHTSLVFPCLVTYIAISAIGFAPPPSPQHHSTLMALDGQKLSLHHMV